MKEFAGGTFGLPCALDPAHARRGRGARQAQARTRCCASTASSRDRSARAHRAALRGSVGERRRSRARRPRRGPTARPRTAVSRSTRVGANVVARTQRGRGRRGSCSAAISTRCPPNNNATPRRDGDTLHGLGAGRHEGRARGDAAARGRARPAPASRDVTLVFYDGEEVADEHNGLRRLFAERPDLVGVRHGGAARAHRPVDRGRLPGHDPHQAHVRGRAGALGPALDGCERGAPRRADARPDRRARGADGHRRRSRLPGIAPGRAGRRPGSPTTSCPTVCEIVVNRRYAPACTFEEALAQTKALLRRRRRGRRSSARHPRPPPNLTAPLVTELVKSGESRRSGRSWAGPMSRASPRTAFRQSTSARAIQSLHTLPTNASNEPISNTACACCRSSWASRYEPAARQIRRCNMTTLP